MRDEGPYNFNGTPWPGLSKVMEECAEVIQVGAKLLATNGKPKHWDGTDLYQRLSEELGDALAAIQILMELNMNQLDPFLTHERRRAKYVMFKGWHERDENPQ